jgi:hypothetical protein
VETPESDTVPLQLGRHAGAPAFFRFWKLVVATIVVALFVLIWRNPDCIFSGHPRILALVQTVSGNWQPPVASNGVIEHPYTHGSLAALAVLLNLGTIVALVTATVAFFLHLANLRSIERIKTVNIASLYDLRDIRVKAELFDQLLRPLELEGDKLAWATRAIKQAFAIGNQQWSEHTLSRFLTSDEVAAFQNVIKSREFAETAD